MNQLKPCGSAEISLDDGFGFFLADAVDILRVHLVILRTEELKRNDVFLPANLLEGLENRIEINAAIAWPYAVFIEQRTNREILSIVEMNDEDFPAVGLGEVLELRAHAMEMEAVERDADVVHVDILNDRPGLAECIDRCCRMADEFDRDAHAVFGGNSAHLLEALDCGLMDFLARDFLEVDRRHRDVCTCLTRYEPGARRELDRVRDVLLEDLPPLCVSLVQRRDYTSAYIDLLRSYLMEVLGGAASLPPRRGRPAKPFYNFPVLSSTAAKPAAPVHPAPGTQLPFAGATNFRELGGYPADEGKTVRWGQIWRGVCTARLTDPADRARLDALGLRLILDLRSTAEAQAEPDYVPDGARLVQICALCGDDGHEISFAPGDIERMMHTAREGENILYRMYRQMLFGNKAFKELFRALEAGETPILFHCSAGKDRTGVAAMLILLALGASDETICADFVQTNVCRKAEIDALLAGHAEEIAADPSKRMRFCTQAGVDPGAAPYVLQVIREACGSAEEYLAREYGLTPARRMRLRRMYLE